MITAVTGGSGFIGRKLVLRHLALGDTVRVLSRKPLDNTFGNGLLEWYQGDLLEIEKYPEFVENVDVLYHCAGQLSDKSIMQALHVNATGKLLGLAEGKVKHWVQLSSVGVYGQIASGLIDESQTLNPVGEYEISKMQSDKLVQQAAGTGNFSCTLLRPSNIFSAEMVNQSLFKMTGMINRGLFFFIGKEGASANYIHVDNVVEALWRCGTMEAAKGEIYNLSDFCTMEQFVGFISKGLNRSSPKVRLPENAVRYLSRLNSFVPLPLTSERIDALTKRSCYSIAKIEQQLNYQTLVSIEQGVLELVEQWKTLQGTGKSADE